MPAPENKPRLEETAPRLEATASPRVSPQTEAKRDPSSDAFSDLSVPTRVGLSATIDTSSNAGAETQNITPPINSTRLLVSTIFKSNTTFSSLANVVWSATTSVPEAGIAHLLLGVRSVWNEFKSKLNGNRSKQDDVNPREDTSPTKNSLNSFSTSLLNSAGLSRIVQAGIFTVSAGLSIARGSLSDFACFLGCVFACSAVAHQMNVQSETRIKLPRIVHGALGSLWNKLPKVVQGLIKDPAPGWLISDSIIGLRDVAGVFTSQCSPISNTFAAIGLGLLPVGLTCVVLRACGKLNIPPALGVNLSAAQHISFSFVNLLAGNNVLGVCQLLWATAGLMVGLAMKANEKRNQPTKSS
jgi:hypothetical protein